MFLSNCTQVPQQVQGLFVEEKAPRDLADRTVPVMGCGVTEDLSRAHDLR